MARWKHRPRADHTAAAEGLREMPGVALRVTVCPAPYTAATLARDIRQGRAPYTPAGAYDAHTEPVDDGTAVLVRFVGTPDTAEQEGK